MPFPTTPKFSAEPSASILEAWGDHLTVVFASFYLTPIEIDPWLFMINYY